MLNCCIKSVYLIANEGFRPLLHQFIYPLETTSNFDREAQFGILWSRDGNLHNQLGFSFEPNHFGLLIPDKEIVEVPSYETSKENVSHFDNNPSCRHSSKKENRHQVVL